MLTGLRQDKPRDQSTIDNHWNTRRFMNCARHFFFVVFLISIFEKGYANETKNEEVYLNFSTSQEYLSLQVKLPQGNTAVVVLANVQAFFLVQDILGREIDSNEYVRYMRSNKGSAIRVNEALYEKYISKNLAPLTEEEMRASKNVGTLFTFFREKGKFEMIQDKNKKGLFTLKSVGERGRNNMYKAMRMLLHAGLKVYQDCESGEIRAEMKVKNENK